MDRYGVDILKKLIFTLLFSTFLFASQIQTEQKIYKLLFTKILPTKTPLKIWSDSKEKREIIQKVKGFVVVDSPQSADICFVTSTKKLNAPNCLIFTGSYKELKRFKESAIGGFFWQKGRPNIIFLRENLKKHHISLPTAMQDYIEDTM